MFKYCNINQHCFGNLKYGEVEGLSESDDGTFIPVYQITRRHAPSTVLFEITAVIKPYVTQSILCVRNDPYCRLIHYRLVDTKLCALAPEPCELDVFPRLAVIDIQGSWFGISMSWYFQDIFWNLISLCVQQNSNHFSSFT